MSLQRAEKLLTRRLQGRAPLQSLSFAPVVRKALPLSPSCS